MPVGFIWFDLGYTLLYNEREKLFKELLENRGLSLSEEQIELAFHVIDKRFMREYPGLLGGSAKKFIPLYFGQLCDYLGIDGSLIDFLEQWLKAWEEKKLEWLAYPFVPEVLRKLKDRGFRLGVISNWDPSARPILQRQGILDFFEVTVISSEVGVTKPDSKIFEIALEKASVKPENCLYVGDNYYDDAVGASAVGMGYRIINRFGAFGVEELDSSILIRDVTELLPYLEKEDR
ncbi:MAG: HAD family hydrolase [Spirochaetia bacterium]|nr:HAD family hydrolase [Spirochaetales bacterium]MDX9784504.1 HAD family hydrolase [Spirochaetia bacterium]